jgi:cell cycle checkpoint protein
VDSPAAGAPVVIIVSDAGVRGETGDERIAAGGGGWGKEVVDIRSVLPGTLLGSAYVTQIGYVFTTVWLSGILHQSKA